MIGVVLSKMMQFLALFLYIILRFGFFSLFLIGWIGNKGGAMGYSKKEMKKNKTFLIYLFSVLEICASISIIQFEQHNGLGWMLQYYREIFGSDRFVK